MNRIDQRPFNDDPRCTACLTQGQQFMQLRYCESQCVPRSDGHGFVSVTQFGVPVAAHLHVECKCCSAEWLMDEAFS